MSEHPVQQPISMVIVIDREGESEVYEVGKSGVTRIEATTKSGMHAYIPYVRIWKGEHAHAEFCQHSIVGVYFAQEDSHP